MGMWDWFRHRRRSQRMTDSPYQQSNNDHPWSFFSLFINTRRPTQDRSQFSMIRSCPQPKCLGRLACSQILYGERIEDFSPDCWLENHLHRFGGQPGTGFGIHDNDSDDDSITGSSDVEDSDSEHSAGTFTDLDNTIFLDRPRLHIEELFMSPEEVDADIDSPGGYRQVIELPPYCEMPNEPPPSYAEAVGLRYEEGSVSARSSSNGSTFLW